MRDTGCSRLQGTPTGVDKTRLSLKICEDVGNREGCLDRSVLRPYHDNRKGCINNRVQLVDFMDAFLSRFVFRRGLSTAVQSYLARPFSRRTSGQHRLLIYYNPAEISFVQVYPFIAWRRALAQAYGTQIRAVPVDRFLNQECAIHRQADTILVGPWFTTSPDLLSERLAHMREVNPKAVIGFLDSYAANDLRLAKAVDPYIDWYLKKSFFKEREQHLVAFRGDTNLTQYYGDLYGISAEPVDWQVPSSILAKLRLSPNFLTAPQFLGHFPKGQVPKQAGRALDMQTRLGKKGTPWYSAMREDALQRTNALPGVTRSSAERVNYKVYMDEMRRSRLCFSPFGYGELCWRDIEAFQTGAVLIKPDMDHLDTLPDLYVPEETYLPVKWDFSDLEDVVQRALADDDLRQRLAINAYERCADYLSGTSFISDMSFLFEPRPHQI